MLKRRMGFLEGLKRRPGLVCLSCMTYMSPLVFTHFFLLWKRILAKIVQVQAKPVEPNTLKGTGERKPPPIDLA